MDEVKDILNMDNSKRRIQPSEDGGPPFHVKPVIPTRFSEIDDGTIRYDPETAHTQAGDPDYEVRLPQTCGICRAKELSEAAAKGEA